MTTFNAAEFAITCAREAAENPYGYADPCGAYFDNLVETLAEYRVDCEYTVAAVLGAYRAEFAAIRATR